MSFYTPSTIILGHRPHTRMQSKRNHQPTPPSQERPLEAAGSRSREQQHQYYSAPRSHTNSNELYFSTAGEPSSSSARNTAVRRSSDNGLILVVDTNHLQMPPSSTARPRSNNHDTTTQNLLGGGGERNCPPARQTSPTRALDLFVEVDSNKILTSARKGGSRSHGGLYMPPTNAGRSGGAATTHTRLPSVPPGTAQHLQQAPPSSGTGRASDRMRGHAESDEDENASHSGSSTTTYATAGSFVSGKISPNNISAHTIHTNHNHHSMTASIVTTSVARPSGPAYPRLTTKRLLLSAADVDEFGDITSSSAMLRPLSNHSQRGSRTGSVSREGASSSRGGGGRRGGSGQEGEGSSSPLGKKRDFVASNGAKFSSLMLKDVDEFEKDNPFPMQPKAQIPVVVEDKWTPLGPEAEHQF